MGQLAQLFKILTWFFVASIVLGFIRPTFVVWWARTQNRMQVLKIYGSSALACVLLWITFCLLYN